MLRKTKDEYIATGMVSSFKFIFLVSIPNLTFNLQKAHFIGFLVDLNTLLKILTHYYYSDHILSYNMVSEGMQGLQQDNLGFFLDQELSSGKFEEGHYSSFSWRLRDLQTLYYHVHFFAIYTRYPLKSL